MSTDGVTGRLPLVILDRDGVINRDSDAYIKTPDEWVAVPGSLEAISRLNHAGTLVAVASNQSGIGRGLFDIEALNAMHAKMQNALGRVGGHLDGIFFCPHAPEAGCECRKPRPGLLHQISARFALPLEGVPFIGDSGSDVAAARSVGAQPLLVRTGKGGDTVAAHPELADVPTFADLAEAVDRLLGGHVGA